MCECEICRKWDKMNRKLPASVIEEEIQRLVELGIPRKKAEQLVNKMFGDAENAPSPLNGLRQLFRRSPAKFLIGGSLIILSILSLIGDEFGRRKRRKRQEEEKETLWI